MEKPRHLKPVAAGAPQSEPPLVPAYEFRIPEHYDSLPDSGATSPNFPEESLVRATPSPGKKK